MCGIVGFVGDQPAAPLVLKAISKLDYRGYDSAGMVSVANGKLHFEKDVGGILDVQRKHRLDCLPGHVALAHVRWATHGKVTPANAHPHFDCHGKIAVVHNGMIENYHELHAELAKKHKFASETDTEVICHLMEDYLNQGYPLERALLESAGRLKGSYAIVAVSSLEPGKIVATATDVPLVVGVNGGTYFVASDFLSFLDQTNEVIYFEDGDVASLTTEGVVFLNSHGKPVVRPPQRVEWRWGEATKGGYNSFMLKEILEEPEVIYKASVQKRMAIGDLARAILEARQVVITACGSSLNAALLGKYLLSRIGGIICHVVTASEFRYFADTIASDTVVVAVSQSGETADVIDGVKRARIKGAKIFSIVNVVGSLLTRLSDRVVYTDCGPEVCVAATKSFVGQVVVFYMLAFTLAGKQEEGLESLNRVADQVRESFGKNEALLRELANSTRDKGSFFIIARGPNLPIAAEAALKLKEIAYVHAECMPAGELKHGTLALIEEGTPVIAICPQDDTASETMGNIMEIKARGGFIIGVSDMASVDFDRWIEIPGVEPQLYPMAAIMPLHLLAYHAAAARGNDPDRPRNLAKSVTVK